MTTERCPSCGCINDFHEPHCQLERDRLRAVNAKLVSALEPFVALLQVHVEETAYQGDDTGVFGINEVTITVGNLRRAREAVEEARK